MVKVGFVSEVIRLALEWSTDLSTYLHASSQQRWNWMTSFIVTFLKIPSNVVVTQWPRIAVDVDIVVAVVVASMRM